MKRRWILFILVVLLSTADTVNSQTRIRFARGTSSTSFRSSLPGIGERSFVVGAYAGQSFTGNINSRGNCVIFAQGSTYSAWTTDRGDNYFNVMNTCRGAASFTITISIR
jgi:hypothetical protein